MALTLVRAVVAAALLPLYLWVQICGCLSSIVGNLRFVFDAKGRERLRLASDSCRDEEHRRARQQLQDRYRFDPGTIAVGSVTSTSWTVPRVPVRVCGIHARLVHAKPLVPCPNGKTILLLHGNPSWSFVWRDVIPFLVDAGHQVYALDWLGHGASDKPKSVHLISFELHIRTLLNVIEELDLEDFFLVAHDWGGCVALCSLPYLPRARSCAGLLLLNTFFPARPSDVTFHSYLLFLAWFFSTGIFGPLIPESWILRFMAPECTSITGWAYDSPYQGTPSSAKASIQRFAHIVPGIPDFVLSQRFTRLWRLVEGVLGPNNFTNVTSQAMLAERNIRVRAWWSGELATTNDESWHLEVRSRAKADIPGVILNRGMSKPIPDVVMVLFGADDPLLPEFKDVLAHTITVTACVYPSLSAQTDDVVSPESRPAVELQSHRSKVPRRSLPAIQQGWLQGGAGHYPMEADGAPEVIAKSIMELTRVVANERRKRCR